MKRSATSSSSAVLTPARMFASRPGRASPTRISPARRHLLDLLWGLLDDHRASLAPMRRHYRASPPGAASRPWRGCGRGPRRRRACRRSGAAGPRVVVVDQRLGLGVVDLQPPADRLLAGRRRAGSAASRPGRRRPRAWAGRTRRGRCGVGFFTHTRRPARRRTTSSSGTSISSAARELALEPARAPASSASACCLVAREAVEQEAVAGVAVADALDDHADDHLVGHQLAGVHVALGLAAELAALRDLRRGACRRWRCAAARSPRAGARPACPCRRPADRAG